MLYVVGVDIRGVVYGLMIIVEKVGILLWYWWVDVEVVVGVVDKVLFILIGLFMFESLVVKYCGVFLNDEDWGLLFWVVKMFEFEIGNIGLCIYEKIFQLLLCFKVNMIWFVMYLGIKVFFIVLGNKVMVQCYQIYVGILYVEFMMCNNVYEWQIIQCGQFDYVNNFQQVLEYWQSWVEELGDVLDLFLFILGMWGIYDSYM